MVIALCAVGLYDLKGGGVGCNSTEGARAMKDGKPIYVMAAWNECVMLYWKIDTFASGMPSSLIVRNLSAGAR